MTPFHDWRGAGRRGDEDDEKSVDDVKSEDDEKNEDDGKGSVHEEIKDDEKGWTRSKRHKRAAWTVGAGERD